MEVSTTITVESRHRDKSTYENPNHYVVHLAQPILNVTQVDLCSAKIANATLNLTDNENCLELTDLNGQTILFTLQKGYYTAESLLQEINDSCFRLTRITLQYNAGTGKFLFLRNQSLTTPFTVRCNANLALLLGLDPTTYTSSRITPTSISSFANTTQVVGYLSHHNSYGAVSGNVFTPYQVVDAVRLGNFERYTYVYLDIEELPNAGHNVGTSSAGVTGQGRPQGTFAPIMLSTEGGLSMTEFRENKNYRAGLTCNPAIERLDRLTVSWRNGDGELVEFEGMENNCFQLRVWHIPERGYANLM